MFYICVEFHVQIRFEGMSITNLALVLDRTVKSYMLIEHDLSMAQYLFRIVIQITAAHWR
jgi:hypothetical protein